MVFIQRRNIKGVKDAAHRPSSVVFSCDRGCANISQAHYWVKVHFHLSRRMITHSLLHSCDHMTHMMAGGITTVSESHLVPQETNPLKSKKAGTFHVCFMWKVLSDGSQQLWLLTFVLRVRSAEHIDVSSILSAASVTSSVWISVYMFQVFSVVCWLLFMFCSPEGHAVSHHLYMFANCQTFGLHQHTWKWLKWRCYFLHWVCQLLGKLQWLHEIARPSVTHRNWLNLHLHVSSCDIVKRWWDSFTVRTYKTSWKYRMSRQHWLQQLG